MPPPTSGARIDLAVCVGRSRVTHGRGDMERFMSLLGFELQKFFLRAQTSAASMNTHFRKYDSSAHLRTPCAQLAHRGA